MKKSIKMTNRMTFKINKNCLKWLKISKNYIIFVLISGHGSTAVLISIVDGIQKYLISLFYHKNIKKKSK